MRIGHLAIYCGSKSRIFLHSFGPLAGKIMAKVGTDVSDIGDIDQCITMLSVSLRACHFSLMFNKREEVCMCMHVIEEGRRERIGVGLDPDLMWNR